MRAILLFFPLLLASLTPALADTTVSGAIRSDTTWTVAGSPYVITSTVMVYGTTTTPATLTIEQGVTTKFASGARLQIGNGTSQGALVARGTSGNRITFARSGASGTWGGISFQDGTVDSSTVLEYADIRHSTGLIFSSASPAIRNTTITDVTGYGLNLSSSSPIFDNVTISCTGSYGIYLNVSNPTITGGSLTNTNASGHGIYGTGSPVITNYAVSIVNTAGKYGLYLNSSTSALSVTNSTIGNGIYLGSTGITPTITGNTITNADNSPPHAGALIIGRLLDTNTFSGLTAAGKLEVVAEQISQDVIWKKWAAPYVVSGILQVYKDSISFTSLTIEPGVTVKFASSGSSLKIGQGNRGTLIANGTAANPIVFTSGQATPAPGNWGGIAFQGEASAASILNHVVIEYGGAGGTYSTANLALNSSSPIIRNLTSRYSAGSGIYLASATNLPRILNSSVYSNKWGIYSVYSNPIINNSGIYGNSTAGVYNMTASVTIDARNNWWGSASGPYHVSNPSGSCNGVSDKVLFSPWLGQAPGSGLVFNNVMVDPPAFNPQSDAATFRAGLSAPANWTITISDPGANVVKTFAGSGATISQKWFGDDSQSVTVPDGIYGYHIDAVAPSTSTTATLVGSVRVMRQVPTAEITEPVDNQVLSGGSVLNITGTAQDPADFKSYVLDYGAGEIPLSWTILRNGTAPVQNARIHAWNLTSATGGVYTIRLTVTDSAGNSTARTARVRLLKIQNAALSERFISPDGNGVKDTAALTATASWPVAWTVTFTNASGNTVRTLTASGSAFSGIWDGKDSAGNPVPDGAYTWRIEAVDPTTGTPALPATGSITVDRTIPAAAITDPVSGATLRNIVSVLGTAADANLDSFRLDYGPATGSGPWSVIATSTTPVTSGSLATWTTNDLDDTVPVQNGTMRLRLTVTDKAGNSAVTSVPVTVDNLNLSDVTVASRLLDTAAGQTAAITFRVNRPAAVTLRIIPEKLGLNGAPVHQATLSCAAAGTYTFTWNGRNTSGAVVPDEAYLYVLDAGDGTRSDSYVPPAPTGTGSVTCIHAPGFDPAKNLPMRVTYTLAQPARVNIFIRWGVFEYTVVDARPALAGSHAYDWDGRNPANKLLDTDASSACAIASLLPENTILTTGGTVKAASLKTDPYTLHLAFGQPTRITYELPRNAIVTVKLTSPAGVTRVLINNQFQTAGIKEISWNGIDDADTNGNRALITENGNYMVLVEARNPDTGTITTARANLKIEY